MSSSRLRQRSSVDLPDPDEPIRQTTSPRRDREVDVGEHDLVAVRLAEVRDLEQRLGHSAPARSRSAIRRCSQSVNRASGMVRTTKKPATTTYGV